MQTQTKAIVLSTLKYKDNSLIVRCYTQQYGVQSYLLHHILTAKNKKINIAYFQVLSQIEIQAIHKPNNTLHSISDVKLHQPYQSLQTNIYKSTVVLFLSEILQNVLKEEEKNTALYHYIETGLLWYDLHKFNANFHLIFLLKLSQHLGIYPNLEKNHLNYFLIKNNNQKITQLKTLLGIGFDELNSVQVNAPVRNEILNEIIHHFSIYLGNFKKPKSLIILQDVFK